MIRNDVEMMPSTVLSITANNDSSNGGTAVLMMVALCDSSCVLPEVVVVAGSVRVPC